MKSILLKIFIVLSLFFPAFYSTFNEEYKMEYYAVFTAAYGVLLLYMLYEGMKGKRKKGQGFVPVFGGVLLIYFLISLYVNYKYLHWYGEQINNTIAFLFFLFLCWYQDSLGEDGDSLVMFFLRCAVLSNLCSILYYFMGYTSYLICNNHFYFIRLPEDYYEFRHYWIYSHKSDYALMLLVFMAAAVRFRDKFKNRITFGLSMTVLLAALFLSHSWTGFLAAGLLIAGAALDRIDWKKFRFHKIYLLWLVFLAAGGGLALKILMAERNIFSLGSRTGIWAGALREIKANPMGWGLKFGEALFDTGLGWSANNAHNVFLNAMLRFSIPVGLCFILLFVMIMIYTLKKSRSFLAVGMWLGCLMLMNMDYALLNYEMGMFLFTVYLVCVYQAGSERKVSV